MKRTSFHEKALMRNIIRLMMRYMEENFHITSSNGSMEINSSKSTENLIKLSPCNGVNITFSCLNINSILSLQFSCCTAFLLGKYSSHLSCDTSSYSSLIHPIRCLILCRSVIKNLFSPDSHF